MSVTPFRFALFALFLGCLNVAQAATPATLTRTATAVAAGQQPTDVVADFDLNGDGMLDIVTVDTAAPHVLKIRLGNGTGNPTQTTGFTINGSPDSLAVGRLAGLRVDEIPSGAPGGTNDSLADIAVTYEGSVRMYINKGANGSAIEFTGGFILSANNPQGNALTLSNAEIADMNNDGFGDVVASALDFDGFGGTVGYVVVFLSQGASGQFDNAVLTPVPVDAGRMAIGNLNGDTLPDVVVTNPDNGSVTVLANAGAGALGDAQVRSLGTGARPVSVAIGNLCGDAANDFAVWSTGPTWDDPNQRSIDFLIFQQQADHQFFQNGGLGTSFHPAATLHSGDIAIADINQDGQNDIVATDPVAMELVVIALGLNQDGNIDWDLSAYRGFDSANDPYRLAVTRLNADAKPDVVTAHANGHGLNLFVNGAAGSGGDPTQVPVPTLTVAKSATGWLFKATVPRALSETAWVRVQYSATPDVEGSWQDIPGGGYMVPSADRKTWKLSTADLPTGALHFRVIAADQGKTDGISVASKQFTLARKVDATVQAITSLTPLKLSGIKGLKVFYDGTNIAKTTKEVTGEQGGFAFFGFAALNLGDVADSFLFQGPAATSSGQLITYYSESLTDITSEVVAGTYASPPRNPRQKTQIFLAVRVGATAVEDEKFFYDVTIKSAHDAAVTDLARGVVQVEVPKDTLFVTNTLDNGDNFNATPGSLRAALAKAFARALKRQRAIIKFEVPGTSNLASIPVNTALPPVIGTGTIIDATSQTTFRQYLTGNLNLTGPTIEFLGNGAGVGLELTGKDCDVIGVKFTNFATGIAIKTKTAVSNIITQCMFQGNSAAGVLISEGATRNYVGNGKEGEGNVFVSVEGSSVVGARGIHITGANTEQNRVYGNHVGYAPGSNEMILARGFNLAGITIDGEAAGNYIGGAKPGEGNWIAGIRGESQPGYNSAGIEIAGTNTTANFVRGNVFGQTATGEARSNRGHNILIDLGASDNVIGGTASGEGNLIFNSSASGVAILSTNDLVCTKNRIEGNTIGGAGEDLGNSGPGVLISGASQGNFVGGLKKGAGNLIIGNGFSGLGGAGITLAGTEYQKIFGNFIGVDANNTATGNTGAGILLINSNHNQIGNEKGGGNTISGNNGHGIYALGSLGNFVFGNRIGVGLDGLAPVPNTGCGVALGDGSHQNQIGYIDRGYGNVIQNNGDSGVHLLGTPDRNQIRGNNHGINYTNIPIDLVGGTEDANGATANDPLDADDGPNSLQNTPWITGIQVSGSKTTITGTFMGKARQNSIGLSFIPKYFFDIYADGVYVGTAKFYADAQGDPVSSHKFSENPDGNGQFTITLPKNLRGKVVTLTATQFDVLFLVPAFYGTSEFSNYAIP